MKQEERVTQYLNISDQSSHKLNLWHRYFGVSDFGMRFQSDNIFKGVDLLEVPHKTNSLLSLGKWQLSNLREKWQMCYLKVIYNTLSLMFEVF